MTTSPQPGELAGVLPDFQPDIMTPYRREAHIAPADLEGAEIKIVVTDGTISLHGPGTQTLAYFDFNEAAQLAAIIVRGLQIGRELANGQTDMPDGTSWDTWRRRALGRELNPAADLARDQAAHGITADGGSLFFAPDGSRRPVAIRGFDDDQASISPELGAAMRKAEAEGRSW